MKKLSTRIISILFACMLFGNCVYADKAVGNYTYEYFTYNVNSDDSVTLVSCDSTITVAEIPNEIDGMKVSAINSSTFEGCNMLKEIRVSEENQYFAVSSEGILTNKTKTKLIKCPANAVIYSYAVPAEITSISPYCFENCKTLEFVTIPENVKTIGKYAFKGTSFNNITLQNPEVSIGSEALGYSETGKNEDFTIYASSTSTANTYATDNEMNFVSIDNDIFNISINGNLYFYNDDKSFAGEKIVITNKAGKKVGYSFSLTPEKVFAENMTNATKVEVLSILGNNITSVNVRVAMAGDSNMDGKINVRDAAFIASTLANGKSFTGFDIMCADKNKDKTANIRDAAEIARELSGHH